MWAALHHLCTGGLYLDSLLFPSTNKCIKSLYGVHTSKAHLHYPIQFAKAICKNTCGWVCCSPVHIKTVTYNVLYCYTCLLWPGACTSRYLIIQRCWCTCTSGSLWCMEEDDGPVHTCMCMYQYYSHQFNFPGVTAMLMGFPLWIPC